MLYTEIIRRVDDFGRIVIPKEIRQRAGITEGTPMEIMMEKDTIVLQKAYKCSESTVKRGE